MSKDLVCGCCGLPFECESPMEGCWCSNVRVTSSRLKEISQRFDDCICRDCLTSFADSS